MLASASPARRKLLQAAGIDPEIVVSGVDESSVAADGPAELCLVLARLKAQAVVDRLTTSANAGTSTGAAGTSTNTGAGATTGTSTNTGTGSAGTNTGTVADALVLGCDSVLSFDGEIFGKPVDADDALKRWQRMRGASGVLHTGHHLVDLAGGRHAEAVASTVVHFAEVSDAEIAAYVATGEPLHVAGAFTIDGIGGSFVEGVAGDPGTVVGLSLPLLRRLLTELDRSIVDLWRTA